MIDERIDLARSEPFALGAHAVRPATCEIVTGQGRTVLEPRVMQVLVAMARRSGEVLSRDDLIAQCWAGRIVGDDAIHRSMAMLRKLSRQIGGFRIETITRVGYSLVPDGAPDPDAAAAPAGPPPRSIAVLPFANMSSDPEQEYFSDGLTEEFICQLSRLKDLRVTGRTPAFAFKGHSGNLREIGEALGVSFILEGSVRKSGERLRISARLVDCAQGFDLWSQTFDRQVGDVFAVQEEIATAVAGALSVAFGIERSYGGARCFEAYDQFLKAGRVWYHLSPEELLPRREHLRRAVAIDPEFGLAWAILACLLAHSRGYLPPEEHEAHERERVLAAQRALQLAPELAESHIAQGCIHTDRREWICADQSVRRGIKGPPGSNPQAESIIGGFLTLTGQLREGLAYRLPARDLEPLSSGYAALLLCSYHTLEMWDEFDVEYERSRELPGNRADLEGLRLLRLLVTGAGGNAVADQYVRLLAQNPLPVFHRLADAHGGSDERIRRALSVDEDAPAWGVMRVAQLAGAYGHPDIAITALRRSTPNLPTGMLQLMWFPEFKATRALPAFKDIARDTGLIEFWRETAAWPEFCRPLGDDDFEFV